MSQADAEDRTGLGQDKSGGASPVAPLGGVSQEPAPTANAGTAHLTQPAAAADEPDFAGKSKI